LLWVPVNLIELYEFAGSCWANVPKLAIAETGFKEGDVEFVSVVLAEVSFFLTPRASDTDIRGRQL
jgi:hypothetical protein